MSAPATKDEWAEAFEQLAEWRAGRPPNTFGHALGIDPYALRSYAVEHAETASLPIIKETYSKGVPIDAALLAGLATQLFVGIEMGLWLAQTGRVKT